jgi:polyhydroxyalkanoate synthesis regulator protein
MMKTPMKALEEQTRRNVEMFQNAMRMFTPFPSAGGNAAAPAEPPKKEEKSDDLQELKAQIAAMQRKLDTMS